MKLVPQVYQNDCMFLLKDLTNQVQEVTIEEKERLIASGVNYSEIISKEFPPSVKAQELFNRLLAFKANEIALYVAKMSEVIYEVKNSNVVLVSLARAGTPFGVLIKRYLEAKYNITVPHYSISIIRGKGIDETALDYILSLHQDKEIQFVDGWTGKGLIINELNSSVTTYNQKNQTNIDSTLAVVSDPAKRCRIYGTREDICIPNCCLNGTVSGLVSRTIHNEDVIKKNEFHGALYLKELEEYDISVAFITQIERHFPKVLEKVQSNPDVDLLYALELEKDVKQYYQVKDAKKIKFGIGESTRVLLRRKPRLLLVRNYDNEEVVFLLELAKEKNVTVTLMPKQLGGKYEVIALIDESDCNE